MTSRIAAVIALMLSASAHADRLSLTWEHPWRDAVAYNVYCGTDPAVRVTAPPHAFEVTGTRTFQCAVTALNAAGAESDRSTPTPEVRCVNGACSIPPACACLTVTPTAYIVAPNGTYTTRPLYDRPGGTRLGSVEIRRPDGTPRPCEAGAPLLTTTSGEWRYTTNNAGLRGAALCKRQ